MRLHLDALPADVLFSIASRHVPSLAALVSASKALRIALLPCLEACVSLRLREEWIGVGTAELLSRLPALTHVWIVVEEAYMEAVEEIHIDWLTLRTSAHVDFASAIRFPLVPSTPRSNLLALLVAPVLRRNRALSGDLLTPSTIINLPALRSGSCCRWSHLCAPIREVPITADCPLDSFTAVLVAGLLETPPPLGLCIDLTGQPRESGTALAHAEIRLGCRFLTFADDARQRAARERRQSQRHRWEHALLNATPMAVVQLNAMRERYAMREKYAMHPASTRSRHPVSALLASSWLTARRVVTRKGPSGGVLSLLVVAFWLAMRYSEDAWALANGDLRGARVGNFHGRDRPGNDLGVALRERMVRLARAEAKRIEQLRTQTTAAGVEDDHRKIVW